ncbi:MULTISPECIES: hypothetical protein [Paenibacillus]|uniref:hypothetical protein n=1 Tax=Paenibacillus TaxID=44249 RepID=UPI0012B6E653|nr:MULTISPECIES: hypothetical protein [Paenibacillus]
MNLQAAITRINAIHWERVGTSSFEIEADLAREFLRRLALFFRDTSTRPLPPFIANVANYPLVFPQLDKEKFKNCTTFQ